METKKISEIGEQYVLITDRQSIETILTVVGSLADSDDWGLLFVLVGDGGYKEVWGCEFTVPLSVYPLYKLHPPE